MVWPLSGGAGGNACVKRESNYHATQQVYAPIGPKTTPGSLDSVPNTVHANTAEKRREGRTFFSSSVATIEAGVAGGRVPLGPLGQGPPQAQGSTT